MLIKDFLSEYIDFIPAKIRDGELLRVTHTATFSDFVLYAKFNETISDSVILNFEQKIREQLGVSTFELICKYTPDLFTIDYVPILFEKLKRKNSVINGFFQDAIPAINGNCLTIELVHGVS